MQTTERDQNLVEFIKNCSINRYHEVLSKSQIAECEILFNNEIFHRYLNKINNFLIE